MDDSQVQENGPRTGLRTFYRVVRTDPPTLSDFLSNGAKGWEPRSPVTAEVLRLWDGLSVYDSLEQAEITARLYERLGNFVSILEIPTDGPVRFEQTRNPAVGHFTVWGEPHLLLSYVRDTRRVRPVR